MLDFASIFENVTLPLTISEPNKPNALLYVNKAFCDLTGYTAEEWLGQNPGKILQHEPYTKTREMIREKLDSYQPVDVLVKNWRKDGSEFWNGLHIHPVIENGVCIYWVGTARDVTSFINESNSHLDEFISTVKTNFLSMKYDIRNL